MISPRHSVLLVHMQMRQGFMKSEMGVNSKRDATPNPVKFPTVIEGEVTDGRLTIRIHNLLKGEVIDTFTYRRR